MQKQGAVCEMRGYMEERLQVGVIASTHGVHEQEQELGTLEDVIETGATDVYQIRLKDGRQLLLPAIKECVLDVDVEAGRMKIHILDGLLED